MSGESPTHATKRALDVAPTIPMNKAVRRCIAKGYVAEDAGVNAPRRRPNPMTKVKASVALVFGEELDASSPGP